MFDFSDKHIIPFGSSIGTLAHAVLERGIFVKAAGGFSPRPEPGEAASFAMFLSDYQRVAAPTARLIPEEFLRSRPGRLKRIYTMAVERNKHEWFDLDKEAITAGFTKVEKTEWPCGNALYADHGLSKTPVPRLINPRTPRFNSLLGCYTIACEHQVYHNIGEMFGMPCIAKGMNFTQRAELLRRMWDSFDDPIFVGQDASRFDQHTGDLALSLDHEVLKTHFPGDKTLPWLLKKQKDNVMYGRCPDGEIRAELGAMRMSGDMNTALGNCVISAALIYQWTKLRKIHAYAIVDGDDAGTIMERRDYEAYIKGASEYFLEHGYNMVIEAPVDIFEQIVFCQTQPVWVGDHWRMVRNPLKALNNDYAGYHKLSDPHYVRTLFHAIGSAGLSLCSGVPVMQAFYELGMRCGTNAKKVKHIETQLHGWHYYAKSEGLRKAVPVHADSRTSFHLAFGITPDDQVVLERAFATMTMDLRVQQAPGDYHQHELAYSATPIATETIVI